MATAAAPAAPAKVDIAELPAIMAAVRAPGAQAVLVNVWATWCMPCRREMPELDRLQRDLDGRGLAVMTVSNEPLDTLRKFAAENRLAGIGVTASKLGWLDAPGRPLTFVIDRQGRVRDLMIGGQTYDRFEKAVRPYLG